MKTIIPYDDYNRKVPPSDKWDYVGTVTPQFGALALRNGWKIIELFEDGRVYNDSRKQAKEST